MKPKVFAGTQPEDRASIRGVPEALLKRQTPKVDAEQFKDRQVFCTDCGRETFHMDMGPGTNQSLNWNTQFKCTRCGAYNGNSVPWTEHPAWPKR